MLGVVALAGGTGLLVQNSIEVVVRAFFPGPGRYQPVTDLGIVIIVGEDRAAPASGFDLERDHVIDRPDPLMRRVSLSELLRRLRACR
jgi:hypothetical protein